MKKVILFALIISVFFSFSATARAESFLVTLQRLFARLQTSRQAAQVKSAIPTAAPTDPAAQIQKFQQEAARNLQTAQQIKQQDVKKLTSSIQQVAVSTDTVCPGDYIPPGASGSTVHCDPTLKKWVADNLVTVGGGQSNVMLSATGNDSQPDGLAGIGGGKYGIGVVGQGVGYGPGIWGMSEMGAGIEGDSSTEAAVQGFHYPNTNINPQWGSGLYGAASAGNGVQGVNWDWTDGNGNLWSGAGVVGSARSGTGVSGYSEKGTGIVGGGKYTGSFFYNWGDGGTGVYASGGGADNTGGTGLAVWSGNGNYGVYQWNSNAKNKFEGRIDSDSDICTALNGGKCLSNLGAAATSTPSVWAISGGNIYNTNPGGVGINTNNPTGSELEVADGNANNDVRIGLRTNSLIGQVGLSGTQMFLNSPNNPLVFYAGTSPRMTISNTTGNITVNSLTGTGNAYACINASGQLYRSSTLCS